METFWNYFNSEQKFNIFLGDEYCKYDKSPSRKDLSSIIFNKIPDSLKNRIRDRGSLTEVSQSFLDLALSSRKNLLYTTKEVFNTADLNLSCYDSILGSSKFEAIFSMNIFLSLEQDFHEKLQAVFPFQEEKEKGFKIPYYRLLGSVEQKENIFLSSQDFKKLMFLEFYQDFWREIREEFKARPTLLVGVDLENIDTQNILTFLLKEIKYEKQTLYLITSNSILNAGVMNFINRYNIKVLSGGLDSFQNYFSEKVVDVQKQFLR